MNRTIQTRGGSLDVPAITLNSCGRLLCIHETPDPAQPGWSITHAPTGYAIAKGLASKAAARRIAQNLWGVLMASDRVQLRSDKPGEIVSALQSNLQAMGIIAAARDTDPRRLRPAVKPAKPKPGRFTLEQIQEATDADAGFCRACGAGCDCCEPDTRGRRCDACGEFEVYGAEELVVMGLVD